MNEPREQPGWLGSFTSDEYPGAMKNGTVIVKAVCFPGDAHPVGTIGRVLGSIGHPSVGIGYFVEWQPRPRMAVFVEGRKIRAAVVH